jgi:tRNA A-37 threonylcarbamoyl transferase component Bud32
LHSANLGELDIDTILRLLPGKRLTALARWHGKRVVIKLFVDPHRWQHHWQEEMDGHTLLVEAHIATPKLLNSEQHNDEAWVIMVYDYITPAESGDRHWQSLKADTDATSTPWQHEFLRQLATTTAKLHSQHLIQWDNHLDNFLVRHDQLYVIDSGGIQHSPKLPMERCLENLAQLIAQFPALTRTEVNVMRMAYHAALPEAAPRIDHARLAREVQRQRRIRLQNYMEKSQRDCTEVMITHPRTGHFMASRRHLSGPELQAWARTPHDVFETPDKLKDGNSQTVLQATLDQRTVVIKRYNVKGLGHWIRRIGRKTRARNAWIAAHALHLVRIATPQPVALLEQALGPLHGPAFFVTEYCEGLTLDKALLEGQVDINTLISEFQALCETMICHRISHGDFKATNFIVRNNRLWLIDLDVVTLHRVDSVFVRNFEKDLRRFMRNWQDMPHVRERFEPVVNALLDDARNIIQVSRQGDAP